MVEKLAILYYLHGQDFRRFIEAGSNPLHDMFASRYEYIQQQDLTMLYFEKISEYKNYFEEAFFRQLKKLKSLPLAGRGHKESYTDTVKRIDDKRHKSYEYVVDNRDTIKKTMYLGALTLLKIYENLMIKEKQGQDMTDEKFALHQYFNDKKTKGNHETFMELFAEANAQLGYFKLPSEYRKFKELIYK